MKLALAKFLQMKWEEIKCEEIKILEDYSGRGMYGETTTAIVCDNPSSLNLFLLDLYLDYDKEEAKELETTMENEDGIQGEFRADHFGKSQYVVY